MTVSCLQDSQSLECISGGDGGEEGRGGEGEEAGEGEEEGEGGDDDWILS